MSWDVTLYRFDDGRLREPDGDIRRGSSGNMDNCIFCKIAQKMADAVVLFEDDEIMAFLDPVAIREGHCQIIPKQHHETFELLPRSLAAGIIAVGQDLAKHLKAFYNLDRVAFLFSGGDVPHAHAHIIPMHEKTDVTSARYIMDSQNLAWDAEHLRMDRDALLAVRDKLAYAKR